MSPLDRLAAGHRHCLHWAGRLLAGAAPPTGDAAAALLACLDDAAPRQQAVEAGCLFPALLKAMAGSDAVCLRQMTQALATDQRRLQTLWRRLRPRLGPAPAEAGTLHTAADAAELQAFAALQTAHSQRMLAELLPMAGRLLDDAALARIDRALRARPL